MEAVVVANLVFTSIAHCAIGSQGVLIDSIGTISLAIYTTAIACLVQIISHRAGRFQSHWLLAMVISPCVERINRHWRNWTNTFMFEGVVRPFDIRIGHARLKPDRLQTLCLIARHNELCHASIWNDCPAGIWVAAICGVSNLCATGSGGNRNVKGVARDTSDVVGTVGIKGGRGYLTWWRRRC